MEPGAFIMDQVEPDKAFPIGAVWYGSALFWHCSYFYEAVLGYKINQTALGTENVALSLVTNLYSQTV